MKKVLVVGGAGYIGGAVTDELIKKGIPFAVYDNLTYEHHYLKPVEFIYGDIRDRAKLSEVLKNFSTVIWIAALVGDPVCAVNPELTKEINQDAVEWLGKNYIGRILFTSTCSVYGANDKPVSEGSDINPLSAYAKTKFEAEKYLEGKNSLIFRLGTAHGVSDSYSRVRMDLAVNYMTMSALKQGFLQIFGGDQWRPFIHVRDIARYLVKHIDTPNTGIYNLATENIKIVDLAKKIHTLTGCDVKYVEQKFEDNRNYNANISKAVADGILDLTNNLDINFSIQQIKELVDQQRINDLMNPLYSNVKYFNTLADSYLTQTINK